MNVVVMLETNNLSKMNLFCLLFSSKGNSQYLLGCEQPFFLNYSLSHLQQHMPQTKNKAEVHIQHFLSAHQIYFLLLILLVLRLTHLFLTGQSA